MTIRPLATGDALASGRVHGTLRFEVVTSRLTTPAQHPARTEPTTSRPGIKSRGQLALTQDSRS